MRGEEAKPNQNHNWVVYIWYDYEAIELWVFWFGLTGIQPPLSLSLSLRQSRVPLSLSLIIFMYCDVFVYLDRTVFLHKIVAVLTAFHVSSLACIKLSLTSLPFGRFYFSHFWVDVTSHLNCLAVNPNINNLIFAIKYKDILEIYFLFGQIIFSQIS